VRITIIIINNSNTSSGVFSTIRDHQLQNRITVSITVWMQWTTNGHSKALKR